MKKVALFAFNGELMCFIHVLLNALDMNDRGYEVKIVIEGSATKLVPELAKEGTPMFRLYEKAKGLDLIDGACKACSNKMGTLEAVRAQGLRLLDEMSGHPSIARYRDEGFEVLTF
ncbi:MAG: cytoplasmic protein [Deltaproteobacteria bacterium]|nr:cytoplasmic protein [Deltaproteobacteria bacterium]MBW2073752.1 cytoplasmic protein [Deltaproteobacteria bacterium]RLB81721.1 MAG: cytoplasmic protein [Deltaproteobacteria bacterium]